MYVGLGLIALALGYQVFVNASKEKEGVKLLGQVIGIVVMIAAVLMVACGVMKCAYKYGGGMGCPMKSAMVAKVCPLSGQQQ